MTQNAGSHCRVDPLSQSLLATATAPSATSKHKTIELHNPSKIVELKFTGTLTFKWRFQWEECVHPFIVDMTLLNVTARHEFEWKREECFIIRKPDPAVLVAITKEAAGRLKTSTVQILDYNLKRYAVHFSRKPDIVNMPYIRFDVQDRKGLEIVILTALLTFQDTNDAYHTPSPNPPPSIVTAANLPTIQPSPSLHSRPSFFGLTRRVSEEARTTAALANQLNDLQVRTDVPPVLPPKPAPRTGLNRIADMHAMRVASGEGEANEVIVEGEGSMEEYAQYVESMLKVGYNAFGPVLDLTVVQNL